MVHKLSVVLVILRRRVMAGDGLGCASDEVRA